MTTIDISRLDDADAKLVRDLVEKLSPTMPLGEKVTHIGVALDSSGSMAPIATETIGAYNSFIDTTRNSADGVGVVTATLVTFGEGMGTPRMKYVNRPLTDMAKLNSETYIPSGNTPMYAAIEMLLNQLEPLDRGPAAFLINIFTDGEENASGFGVQERVAERIKSLQLKGNWTFTFVGANVDLNKIRRETNIPLANMLRYTATSTGTLDMAESHRRAMGNFMESRKYGAAASTTFYNPNSGVSVPLTNVAEEDNSPV